MILLLIVAAVGPGFLTFSICWGVSFLDPADPGFAVIGGGKALISS